MYLVFIHSYLIFQEVYARFSIDRSVSIVIQLLNESWQEYVDVEKDDDILAGKKYRVVLDTPKILYVEDSLPNYDEFEADLASHVPTSFDTCESNASGSSKTPEPDLISATASQSSFSLYNITIPTQDFSSRLSKALKDQVPLPRVLRSELIHSICSSVWKYSKYPKSIVFTDLARAVVSEYPHLRESTGTGYDGWRVAIREKFKNMRRLDQSEEVVQKKKNNMSKKP